MFTCVIHFLFIRCEIYLLFYSIFFSLHPSWWNSSIGVYCRSHTYTLWKTSERCYPSVKRAKHFIEPKKEKERGGVIQFELLHTFCVIQDNFESNYLFQTQNLHSSDFCSFSLHAFPLQIQRCSLN